MEKNETANGLRIEVRGNSIRFYTPEGKTYFKNFIHFLEVLRVSNPKKSTFTFAPESKEQIKQAAVLLPVPASAGQALAAAL